MNKKQFFKNKEKQVQYSIWELEFKIKKSRDIREEVRQQRDVAVETLAVLEKEEKKDEARLAKQKDDISRYERQMQMLDNEINGVPAEGENPGQNGLLDTLRSYAELKNMYKEYSANA